MSGRASQKKQPRRTAKGLRKPRKKKLNQRINNCKGSASQRGPNQEEICPRLEESQSSGSLPLATVQAEVTQEPSKSEVKYVGGEFILGPKLGGSPVASIQHYLARRDNTDEFYVIKMLTRKAATATPTKEELKDEISGQTLILTEHSILSLLANEPGIFHGHGLIKENTTEKVVTPDGEVTWKEVTRFSLVMECYVPHDYSPKYSGLITLQMHVIQEKRLKEAEAIRIFYRMLKIVTRIHEHNIVHRDLKLGNFILNKETGEVSLTNFVLARHLAHEHEPIRDQRGSPAYVSPDVVSGGPYFGKPTDMWGLGVVLYTMIYGSFPFYDPNPAELFRKIKAGRYEIPVTETVSVKTLELIKSLLDLDWKKRPTASKAKEEARQIIAEELAFLGDSNEQVVPASDPKGARHKAERIVNYFELQDLMQENEAMIKALINGPEGEAELGNQISKKLERTSFQEVI